MTTRSKIIWSIKELTQELRSRQLNSFDCNLGVSGKRGNGKSTLLFKIFNSFKKHGFNQKEHQVYSQKKVINLLGTQTFGFVWDDEAINSAYKRDFQGAGQKDLIKVVTNYRDNYNIYGSAIPSFYSLDKDLRDLIFVHIHIIERGFAVLFLPLQGQIHSSDSWDTKNNVKIEEKENRRVEKNPKLTFRYHKFTTFAGYMFFGPMTPKQEKYYKKLKREGRERTFAMEKNDEDLNFKDRVYNLLIERKLTNEGLLQACLSSGKKYSSVLCNLNTLLKDNGINHTASYYIRKKPVNPLHSKLKGGIINLVPSPPS